MELVGARVVVCGGARRLGRAIAVDLAEAGCDIAIVARSDAAEATEEIRRAGRQAHAVYADLADPVAARRAIDESTAALGGLDALVYTAAGGFSAAPLAEITPELVEEALGVGVRGLIFAAQAAASTITPGGAIVVIGDVAGVRGWPSYLPHSAAKGAQRALVQGLARSLAPTVRVNLVHPGTVLPPDDLSAETVAAIASRVPLQRIGAPSDLGEAVRYLLGADFVTGTELVVDGGRLAL
jgi:NAD(P)-dependent dehydrogenase (short-subunit alcohol dehydrogenase family)